MFIKTKKELIIVIDNWLTKHKFIMDKASEDRIAKLHPKVQPMIVGSLNIANVKLTARSQVRIAQGIRTFAEQDALYAIGRTKPGKKVTNARAGDSIHNFGLAVDIVLIIDGKEASWDVKKDWDNDKQSDWMEVVAVFKQCGFKWGGDWVSFKDMPHFECTFGFTLAQLKAKLKAKDFIAGTDFVNV